MVRIASPTFVGRVAELAALDEALDAAAQGRTSTVLIAGDAGVGKSRLLETWNTRAPEHGATIAAGSCLDLGESGPAYVAIVQALRVLLRPLPPAAVDALVGSDRSTLALVIPEIGADTGQLGDGQRSTPIAQTRLFDRLVRVLDRASLDAPLVLELEDIHWADPSTRAFLLYVVENARSSKLLIIATFRPEEAGRDHPLASLLRQLDRHPRATRIDLPPFDVHELQKQLMGILGEPLSPQLLSAIYARSEGNALFAEELVATGDPATDLPVSIGAALLSRAAGCSRAAQAALRVASVSGRTISYDVLRSATALSDDDLGDALREAVSLNILEPEHAGEGYRFRHALLQEAIYRDTLPGERRRIHSAVAEALEGGAGTQPGDSTLASQLAHHWFEAKDHDRALSASMAAGETAVRQAAYAEALNHYRRALDLWDKAPIARADLERVDVLERASRSAFLAGEPIESVTHAQRALDELVTGDGKTLRVRVLDLIARALHSMSREDEARTYELQLAAIEVDRLPVFEHAMVLDSRVRALRWQGDRAGAKSAALEALRLADDVDDPEIKGDAHVMLAWVLYEAADYEGATAEGLRAREYASIAGDAETEFEALSVVYDAQTEAGQYQDAIEGARTAGAFAEQAGLSRWGGPWASYAEARALLELGRMSESSEVIAAALVDVPADRSYLILHLLAAEVSIVQGLLDDAARHVQAARIPVATLEEESRGYLASVRAQLARAEGRLGEVRTIVDATAPRVAGLHSFSDMSETIWPLVEVGLDAEASRAEAARAAGDGEAVEMCLSVAKALVRHVDHVKGVRDGAGIPDTGKHRGDEALINGHLARIEGRDDPAIWAVASDAFPQRSPRGLRARYRQAEAMLAAKWPKDETQSVMEDALAIAVDIGARPLAGRFEALARRARIALRVKPSGLPTTEVAVEPDEAPAPGTAALRGRGLSHREIEVLTLVAAGFSNHDIGTRLFISDKTASVHVSHILDKLNVASRTEAATIGVRLGLPDVKRDGDPG